MAQKRFKTLRLKCAAGARSLTKKKTIDIDIKSEKKSLIEELPKKLIWMIIDYVPETVVELRQVKLCFVLIQTYLSFSVLPLVEITC